MFCSNCGKEVPEGNKFCKYCGEKVIYEVEKSDDKVIVKKNRIIRIIGFVAVGVFFALASITILIVVNNQKQGSNVTQSGNSIESDNTVMSGNTTQSANTTTNSDTVEEVEKAANIKFTQEELDEINSLVYICFDNSRSIDEGVFDVKNAPEDEVVTLILVLANVYYRDSKYMVGEMADSKLIFSEDFGIEMEEVLGVDLKQINGYERIKFENSQYLMSIGDGGWGNAIISLSDYRIENDQVIIEGYIENYDDESLQLVELQKIEVIGERNENSSIGHFKLSKIQFVGEGITQ